MKIVRLGSSVTFPHDTETLTDDEELAYAVATSMVPRLQQLIAERTQVRSNLEEKTKTLAGSEEWLETLEEESTEEREAVGAAQEDLRRNEQRLREVEDRPWRFFRWLWMLFWGKQWKADRAAAQRAVEEEERSLADLQQGLDDLSASINESNSKIQELAKRQKQLKKRARELQEVPQIVKGIRRFDYPLVPLEIREAKVDARKGKSTPAVFLFADPNGDPEVVEVPVVGMSPKELQQLEEDLDESQTNAVLLDPLTDADSYGELGKLVGSEKKLLDVAEGLKEFAEKTTPQRFDLPLIRRDTALGSFLSDQLEGAGEKDTVEASLDQQTSMQLDALMQLRDAFQSTLATIQKRSEDFYRKIDDAAKDLTTTSDDWEEGRSNSNELLSRQLEESRLNSKLVRYHVYCPSCNATPRYLERKYRVSEHDIKELNTAPLIRALRNYQQGRFSKGEGKKFRDERHRERVEESWQDAFDQLKSLENRYRAAVAELENLEAQTTPDGRSKLRKAFNRREIRNLREWYRALVRTITRHPFAEWNENVADSEAASSSSITAADLLKPDTRLVYRSPAVLQGIWRCPLCRSDFDTQTALLGAVDKLRFDVAYPLVSTLWNDDAIWSKTLDALENAEREVRDRSEQETKALQAPIGYFKDDARQIRLQLIDAAAKGQSTAARLEQMAEQFHAAGLLPKDELKRVSAASAAVVSRVERIDAERKKLKQLGDAMDQIIRGAERERRIPTSPDQEFILRDSQQSLLALSGVVDYELEDDGTGGSGTISAKALGINDIAEPPGSSSGDGKGTEADDSDGNDAAAESRSGEE